MAEWDAFASMATTGDVEISFEMVPWIGVLPQAGTAASLEDMVQLCDLGVRAVLPMCAQCSVVLGVNSARVCVCAVAVQLEAAASADDMKRVMRQTVLRWHPVRALVWRDDAIVCGVISSQCLVCCGRTSFSSSSGRICAVEIRSALWSECITLPQA